jgi:hypothetical protein
MWGTIYGAAVFIVMNFAVSSYPLPRIYNLPNAIAA